MAVISMKQLLEAGVHFGHQTRRWNPKMAQYIFTERNGIYIIDLQKTVRKVDEAYMFVRDVAHRPARAFCSSAPRSRLRSPSQSEAKRCGMFYVNNRWLGGMLTNFTHHPQPHRPSEPRSTLWSSAATSTYCPRRKSSSLLARAREAGEEPGRHPEHEGTAGRAVRC